MEGQGIAAISNRWRVGFEIASGFGIQDLNGVQLLLQVQPRSKPA